MYKWTGKLVLLASQKQKRWKNVNKNKQARIILYLQRLYLCNVGGREINYKYAWSESRQTSIILEL